MMMMSRSSPCTFSRFFTNRPQNTSFSSRTYSVSSRAPNSLSSSAKRLRALSISACCASEKATTPMLSFVSRCSMPRTSWAM